MYIYIVDDLGDPYLYVPPSFDIIKINSSYDRKFVDVKATNFAVVYLDDCGMVCIYDLKHNHM